MELQATENNQHNLEKEEHGGLTQMLIAALFIIAKIWKQYKYPLWRMDKQNVVRPYSGKSLCRKEEWSADTYTAEPWKH